jgi:hypothetical protein
MVLIGRKIVLIQVGYVRFLGQYLHIQRLKKVENTLN